MSGVSFSTVNAKTVECIWYGISPISTGFQAPKSAHVYVSTGISILSYREHVISYRCWEMSCKWKSTTAREKAELKLKAIPARRDRRRSRIASHAYNVHNHVMRSTDVIAGGRIGSIYERHLRAPLELLANGSWGCSRGGTGDMGWSIFCRIKESSWVRIRFCAFSHLHAGTSPLKSFSKRPRKWGLIILLPYPVDHASVH